MVGKSDVLIGTYLKADNHIGFVIGGGKQYNRKMSRVPLGAQNATEVKSIPLRKVEVELGKRQMDMLCMVQNLFSISG